MTRADDLDEDLLLAHLHGTAGPETSDRIEAAAASDLALRAELAVMGGLKGALAAATDGPDARAFGWRRLEAEIARTRAAPARRTDLWRIAAMLLGALVLGQGTYIALAPGAGDAPLYRTVSSETAAFVLGVAFAPGATAAEIEALLRETEARIVDGPTALGLYRLAFETAGARDDGRAVLDASALVDLLAEE